MKNSILLSDMLEDYKDIVDINDQNKGLFLIIKKYYNLKPDKEFRCFVRKNKLIAICQRNTFSIFESIKTNENHIQELIIKFYEETMTEFN